MSGHSDKTTPGEKLLDGLRFMLPFVVVTAVWELTVRCGLVEAGMLPAPSMLGVSFLRLLVEKQVLMPHILHSLYRLAIGYVLAVGCGIVIGTVLGLNRTVRAMFEPALSLLLAVPTIAWIPVLLITMGLGDKTVITAIFLGGVFEMSYSMIAGIRAVDPQQVNAARIMGLRGVRLFLKVLLPASLVTVMPALRLSVGYCWRALVGGEMLSAMIT